MKTILIIIGSYLPGYKGGGPVLSVQNLIKELGSEYHFKVLTSDHDIGETEPYKGITADCWAKLDDGTDCFYASRFNQRVMREVIKDVDFVYCCGCFSKDTRTYLELRRKEKLTIPTAIASMGLFSPRAFAIHGLKKRCYIIYAKMVGLYRGVVWSATSVGEEKNIKNIIGKSAKVSIAHDIPRRVNIHEMYKEKEVGHLDVIFLSRISPEKNLIYAINCLQQVCKDVKIDFHIVGPMEDESYWAACENELKQLPDNVTYSYDGMVAGSQVIDTFRKHQVFLFPTMSENYGHVIQESLSAGCPAVISDNTPWSGFEVEQVGAVIPLEEQNRFVREIEHFAAMDKAEFNEYVNRAIAYAYRVSDIEGAKQGYRDIFDMS